MTQKEFFKLLRKLGEDEDISRKTDALRRIYVDDLIGAIKRHRVACCQGKHKNEKLSHIINCMFSNMADLIDSDMVVAEELKK